MAPHAPDVARNLALALVSTSSAPLLLLDRDLRLVAASTSFCSVFQLDPARAEQCRLADLGAGEWGVPQLIALLNATASGMAEVTDYEMDLLRDGQAPRRWW